MRHIILHHHIFKNAGTTLDFSLQRQFGAGFSGLHEPHGVLNAGAVIDFLDQNPDLKALSSHDFHTRDFAHDGYRFFNLALVRRPLPRMLSIYTYSLQSDGELAVIARQTDVRGFLEQLIKRYPHLIDNPQVNVFANHGFYQRPTNDDDLRIACARFGSFALCAPVERYDEAMVTLEYFNAPVYAPQGLDFSYILMNTSTPLKGANDPRSLLGPQLFDWITAMSARDEQLWQFANRELDRRIRAVPNYAERLVAFRQRCRKLQIDYDYVDRLKREAGTAQTEMLDSRDAGPRLVANNHSPIAAANSDTDRAAGPHRGIARRSSAT